MAGTNSAPDVSFFCLGSALYNFSYLLLVAGGMECMVPSSFCGCISPLLCLLLLIYALPSFIISLNLYPYVVGTRLVDGRVPLLLFFFAVFFLIGVGWGGVIMFICTLLRYCISACTSLHFLTYIMLRYCMSACTSSHI